MQSIRYFIKSIAGTAAYLSIGGVGINVFASGMSSGFTKVDMADGEKPRWHTEWYAQWFYRTG